MKTFNAGDKVVITGWPVVVHGTVGKTQQFLGKTHYYVLCDGHMSPGMLCDPDRMQLEVSNGNSWQMD